MEEAGLAESPRKRRRRLAIDGVSTFLSATQWQPMGCQEVRCVDKQAVAGWSRASKDGKVMVILDDNWPFSAPGFYLAKDHSLIGKAHVEGNGRLCLAPPHATYSQNNSIELLKAILHEAEALIATPDGRNDFIDEFQSYWLRDMKPKRRCHSLLEYKAESRMVWSWHGKIFSVFSDSEDELRHWLKKIGRTGPISLAKEPLFWLQDGIVPSEYPKRARQLWDLIAQKTPTFLPFLEECAAHPVCRVLIGFDTSTGPALTGLTIKRPPSFVNGFRQKAMPKPIAISRFFGKDKVEACLVERSDHEWIHSRGGEAENARLKSKKVVVIGCGSLGSGISVLLAKSGVGHITLVDDDILRVENIARHSLGFSSVGQNKASALSRELNRQMPTIRATGIVSSWQEAVDKNKLRLQDADLIVSTTGEWLSDSMLNFEGRTNLAVPPLIFGWLEEYALAGHALFVTDIGGCLGCGMNEFGVFRDRLTEWPNGSTHLRVPACGGHYQPYGALNLSVIQSLVANTIIDFLNGRLLRSELRSWQAAEALVREKGGCTLNTSIPPLGGYSSRLWQKSQICQLCQ